MDIKGNNYFLILIIFTFCFLTSMRLIIFWLFHLITLWVYYHHIFLFVCLCFCSLSLSLCFSFIPFSAQIPILFAVFDHNKNTSSSLQKEKSCYNQKGHTHTHSLSDPLWSFFILYTYLPTYLPIFISLAHSLGTCRSHPVRITGLYLRIAYLIWKTPASFWSFQSLYTIIRWQDSKSGPLEISLLLKSQDQAYAQGISVFLCSSSITTYLP